MNIIVLCGGLSMERDVSIKSGAMIANALRENGHHAVLVDSFFGYQGKYDDPSEIFTMPIDDSIAEIKDEVPNLELIKASRVPASDSRIGSNVVEVCRAADIVFLALHGSDGEDGRIQALFDIEGIKYTGCGYLGSAIAMNKSAAKDMMKNNHIKVPEGRTINIKDADKSAPCFPCVVKPRESGSSVGTSVVYFESEYKSALDYAFRYGENVIVERYIKGREIDVGVLAGHALSPIEICPKIGFFDYKNKYQAGMTDEFCPADIAPEIDLKLRSMAEAVFNALYLEIYARMDFIVEDSGEVYCLEANTLPGMTPASLMPKEAKVDGISYNNLCELIINESLKKYK